MLNLKDLFKYLLVIFILFAVTKGNAQTPDNSTKAPASQVTNPASVQYPNNVPVNFVRTWIPQQPYATDAEVFSKARTVSEVNHVTAYADGFGRPLQTVSWQSAPVTSNSYTSMKDQVSFKVYDEYGRETYSYLPYTTSSWDAATGFLNIDPVNSQNGFYNDKTDPSTANYNSEVLYGKTVYDNSPLNRVVKTFAPGNSWAGTEGSATAEHSTKIDYLYNIDADKVRIWTITNNALTYLSNDVSTNMPASTDVYGANQLSKTVITDEHKKQVIEYKDKEGKLILKKVQIAASPSGDYTGWLCTFYVYDDFGRLRFIIPPKAVTSLSNPTTFNWNLSYNNTSLINELCFRYEYDGKNRLIAKKSPGAGWVYMVYDNKDRLIYTQDANLRNSKKWMGTRYDDLDRPVQTGMLINFTGNRDALQNAVQALGAATVTTTGNSASAVVTDLVVSSYEQPRSSYQASSSIVFEDGFSFQATSNLTVTAEIVPQTGIPFTTTQTFNNDIVPSGATFIPLTLTYYDDYSWTSKQYNPVNNSRLTIGSNNYGDPLPAQKSAKVNGLVTGTRVKVIEDPTDLTKGAWLESVGFYDDKDRLVQVKSDNYKGGEDVITSRYNFTGDVLCTYEVYNNTAGNISNLRVKTLMEYDHAGRLLKVTKTLNDDDTKARMIAQYAYDALGNLLNKKLGNKTTNGVPDANTVLENDNYAYNIRGWLKGINWANYGGTTGPTTAQTSMQTDKWFAMDLSYDWGFSTNQYNGSIGGMRWKTAGDMEERAYSYSYDAANRFTGANFKQNFGGAWTNTDPTPPAGGTFQIDFTVAGISYDENGNLKKMQQYGLQTNSSPLLDNLTYTSVGYSNKLQTVTDASGATNNFGDFMHRSTGTVDYGYDLNGNIISDLNKGIKGTTGLDKTSGGGILYNYLDQPYKTTVTDDNNNTKTISYIYDAVGNKLEKKSTAADGNITVTTYIGGFVYQNNVLQYFSHEEGRVRVQRNMNGAFKDFVYDYFLTDHLGNVRMILTDEVPDRDLYLAGMEDANRSFEVALFGDKINATATSKPVGFDDNTTPVPASSPNQKVAKVNGATADSRVGPGVVLKVMAGDKFKGSTYGWYRSTGMDNSTNSALGDIVTNLLSQLTPQVASLGKGGIGGGVSDNILQPGVGSFTSTQVSISGAPKAFLNYILLDEKSFHTVQSGFVALPSIAAGDNKKLLQFNNGADITLTHNGYLYVWVSNESKGDVYFDDIRIDYQQGPLLEENHFYPFGLKMAALSSRAFGSLLNKFQYQGSYSEFDEEAGYNEFALRNYDPQLGRWTGVDPYDEFPSPYTGMGNDPINNVDPDGGNIFGAYQGFLLDNPIAAQLTTTFAGFAIGATVDLLTGGNGSNGAKIGAGIGFAAGTLPILDYNAIGTAFGNAGKWFGGLFQGGSGWLDLYKADLINYAVKQGATKPSENDLGTLFEDLFEDWAKNNKDKRDANVRKNGTTYTGGFRNTKPDFVGDAYYILNEGGVNIPTTIKGADWYELKQKSGGLYLSSNEDQVAGHIDNLRRSTDYAYQRYRRVHYQSKLYLVTTADVKFSEDIMERALKNNVIYEHNHAQYRILKSGNWKFKFNKIVASTQF